MKLNLPSKSYNISRARISDFHGKAIKERRLAILQRRAARYTRAAWAFNTHASKMLNKQRARAASEGITL